MRASGVGLLMAVLVLAACGNGTEQVDQDVGTDTTASSVDDQPGGSNTGSDGAGNYAIVNIGSNMFEIPADSLNLCNSPNNLIFGSFAVDAAGTVTQAGGPDVGMQINFGIPATDWEAQGLQPPGIDVDLRSDGIRWWANHDRGLGSVDSWELADGRATGSAMFVAEETGAGTEGGMESGTFEVVCLPPE